MEELIAWLGYNTGKYVVPGLIAVFLIYGFIYRPLIERRRNLALRKKNR